MRVLVPQCWPNAPRSLLSSPVQSRALGRSSHQGRPGPGLGFNPSLQPQSVVTNTVMLTQVGREGEHAQPRGKAQAVWVACGFGQPVQLQASSHLSCCIPLYSEHTRLHCSLSLEWSPPFIPPEWTSTTASGFLSMSPGACASWVTLSLLFLFRYVLSLAE